MHRRPLALVCEVALVILVSSVFAFLVGSFARHSSPTFDEVVRLPAGITYLRWHDYRLNADHPPFLKKLVALPLLAEPIWLPEINNGGSAQNGEVDWRTFPDSRAILENAWVAASGEYFRQWIFAHDFLYGMRDETIARLRQGDPNVIGPFAVPSTERLSKADFRNDPDRLFFRARLVVIGLGVLLAQLVYIWSRSLFGVAGAMLSLLLFCFDPSVIAHSGLITGDLAQTLFVFGALYFLWRVYNRVEIVNVALFLLCFAAAFVTKFSATALIVIFWLALIPKILSRAAWPTSIPIKFPIDGVLRRLGFVSLLFLSALLTTFLMIWAVYDFRYSATKVDSNGGGRLPIEQALYRQAATRSELKRSGVVPHEKRKDFNARVAELSLARPLTGTGKTILFAARHHILPEAYLYGLAHTQMDPLMRMSFLRGEYSPKSFRSAYFWAFLLKTPLPAMIAIAAAITLVIARRAITRPSFLFIGSAVVIFFFSISIFAAGNVSHRYLLPIYPLLYVLCGVLGPEWLRLPQGFRRFVASLAVALIIASSQFVFYPLWRPAIIHPHYLAYFNEIAGGPRNGYRTLVDSNLDWGQDLNELRKWLDVRNIKEPIWLSYFGMADARFYQISHISVPKVLGGYPFEASPYTALEGGEADKAVRQFIDDLRPGQYLAISATNLSGVYLGPQTRDVWDHLLASCTYLDQIGYSMLVFRIGLEESSRGE